MNAQEFEQAVRELRSRQRRFFHCKKDDPDRPKALEQVKEQEKVLLAVIEPVMALRPAHKTIESDRERFFLSVEFMLRKQREWIMSGGGSWSMNHAREAEKVVDEQLRQWAEERKEEKRRQAEANQTSLFS